MPTADLAGVLDALGLQARRIAELKDVPGENGSWLVELAARERAGAREPASTSGSPHLDSRPYELAIARTYRAPEVIDAYRDELTRHGWPLSALEEAALGPVYRAFRVDMVAWLMEHGRLRPDHDRAPACQNQDSASVSVDMAPAIRHGHCRGAGRGRNLRPQDATASNRRAGSGVWRGKGPSEQS